MNFSRYSAFFFLMLSWLLVVGCSTVPKSITEIPPKEDTRDIRIMSWNIKKLGRASLDYASAVKLLREGDVIALQEVNIKTGKAALEKISLMLEKEISEKTCEGITEATNGPGAERYAFIWINSKVSLLKENGEEVTDCPPDAVTIGLNTIHADKIDREPGQAVFRVKGTKKRFTLANVHLVPTAKKPANEVPWLFASVEKIDGVVIVVGDFNLGSSHAAFDKAREAQFGPALSNEKTSLKMSSRMLNEPYDNIWVRGATVDLGKVINLYERFPEIEQKKIYNEISDHSPITATIWF